MVSFGQLGVLARNGWYCREADVERWNALAGWRGLNDPAVWRHFNGTFLAFEAAWGPTQELMTNLGLRYAVANLGADAAPQVIRARLDASIPSFFYLWSPHPYNTRYALNRIQLPEYSAARYKVGLSDFPIEMLEKVGAKTLSKFAPAVAGLYSRFRIGSDAQESMLTMIDAQGWSAMQAVCLWMRDEDNEAIWKAWIPAEQHTCDAGQYAVDDTNCAPCPAGSGSVGGAGAACVQCSAGATG